MHRDINPYNLMFETKGDVASIKLIDFGLSEFVYEKPLFCHKCGTPGFIALEVTTDKNYDEKCDVYSAGCIFYQLLAGEQAFKGSNNTMIKKVMTSKVNLLNRK